MKQSLYSTYNITIVKNWQTKNLLIKSKLRELLEKFIEKYL